MNQLTVLCHINVRRRQLPPDQLPREHTFLQATHMTQ